MLGFDGLSIHLYFTVPDDLTLLCVELWRSDACTTVPTTSFPPYMRIECPGCTMAMAVWTLPNRFTTHLLPDVTTIHRGLCLLQDFLNVECVLKRVIPVQTHNPCGATRSCYQGYWETGTHTVPVHICYLSSPNETSPRCPPFQILGQLVTELVGQPVAAPTLWVATYTVDIVYAHSVNKRVSNRV